MPCQALKLIDTYLKQLAFNKLYLSPIYCHITDNYSKNKVQSSTKLFKVSTLKTAYTKIKSDKNLAKSSTTSKTTIVYTTEDMLASTSSRLFCASDKSLMSTAKVIRIIARMNERIWKSKMLKLIYLYRSMYITKHIKYNITVKSILQMSITNYIY